LCYLFGTLVFYFVLLKNGNALPFLRLLLVCVIPYVLPDAAKLLLADVISKKVSKFV
ncbi:MAG: biotin transporter BioY, partial [Clostridia bacterium]|nr:biotin transporter BioY [Clostridia bacterium]